MNFQYIKSYEDHLNSFKMRAKPKSQFCQAATNLCCGWGKQIIWDVNSQNSVSYINIKKRGPRGTTQIVLVRDVTDVQYHQSECEYYPSTM